MLKDIFCLVRPSSFFLLCFRSSIDLYSHVVLDLFGRLKVENVGFTQVQMR